MRVYKIGRDHRPSDIDTGEAARRFLDWFADDANPVLIKTRNAWVAELARTGGFGALAESLGIDDPASAIDTWEAARRCLAWLVDDANPLLTEIIHAWMWEPADTGGLGALAETVGDVAMLRAEIIAGLQPAITSQVPADGGGPASTGQPAGGGEAR